MKILGLQIKKAPQRLSPRSADEVWVTADNQYIRVGDMDESHVRHSLAMILRQLRRNKWMRLSRRGKLQFFRPTPALWQAAKPILQQLRSRECSCPSAFEKRDYSGEFCPVHGESERPGD